MYPTKKLVDKDTMTRSILALRDELIDRSDTTSREILFKINSCLYSKYPTKD